LVWQYVSDGNCCVFNAAYSAAACDRAIGSPKREGAIRNRRFIDDRPVEVNEKQRIGGISFIMNRLNNQPRKSLGYATLNEVFEQP